MKPFAIRRLFKARDPREFKIVRSNLSKQTGFKSVGSATLSRIERGASCFEKTALALHEEIQKSKPDVGFEQLFEHAVPDWYDWDQVSKGAARIGRKLRYFGADAVLTFPGPSQIFASLTIAKALSNEEFLRTPIHTAVFGNKRARANAPALSGFIEVTTDEYTIFLPSALVQGDKNRKRRIAILDDAIITGLSMRTLKRFLIDRYRYQPESIWTACCVCFKDAVYRPDVSAYVAQEKEFHLPWGNSFSFESCFHGDLGHPR